MGEYLAMMSFDRGTWCALGVSMIIVGCASPRSIDQTNRPEPALAPTGEPSLPPVPPRHGPLQVTVVYPPPDTPLDPGDTTFIFGSLGTGGATLTVNAEPVRVWPNGAWLAWTVPGLADTVVTFQIRATQGGDTVDLVHRIPRQARFDLNSQALWVDTTSFSPIGSVWWPQNEALLLSVRATPGSAVSMRMANEAVIPFREVDALTPVSDGIRDFDRDRRNLRRQPLRGLFQALYPGPGQSTVSVPSLNPADSLGGPVPMLVVANGNDTLRVPWPLHLARLLGPSEPVLLSDETGDGITPGRSSIGASYHWLFPKGTVVTPTGRMNDNLRVTLGEDQDAWVAIEDVEIGAPTLGSAVVGSLTLTPGADRTTVRIPVGRRVPFQVIESAGGIGMTLYGVVGDLNWIRYGPQQRERFVQEVHWRQTRSTQLRLDFDLVKPLWGYQTTWDGDDLLLEIRHPPALDPIVPLRGLTMLIDAGHPPGGATGPTGLSEADANLAIAARLAARLRAVGATVLETRPTRESVPIGRRVFLVDSLGGDLLISIHNNALPDGVNPFTNSGTSTFYNHSQGLSLARSVQQAMVTSFGLRDLGVARGDLALVRVSWMPAILTEGLFLMHPDHEAFLRSSAGQERYAEAVFAGIEGFLRRYALAQ